MKRLFASAFVRLAFFSGRVGPSTLPPKKASPSSAEDKNPLHSKTRVVVNQTRREVPVWNRFAKNTALLAPMERWVHPAPFRTRKLSTSSPMILHIYVWERRPGPTLYQPKALRGDVSKRLLLLEPLCSVRVAMPRERSGGKQPFAAMLRQNPFFCRP